MAILRLFGIENGKRGQHNPEKNREFRRRFRRQVDRIDLRRGTEHRHRGRKPKDRPQLELNAGQGHAWIVAIRSRP